jgi:serine/threonine protein kinase
VSHHIEMHCPHCGHELRVRDEFVGHWVTCRYCKNPFEVRAAVETAAAVGASGSERGGGTVAETAASKDNCDGPCGVGIPGYQTLGLIRNGSMGRVFKAKQTSVDRVVAVKVLHEDLAHRVEYAQRFRREAAVAARVGHTNIVHVLDAGMLGDCPYLVMEYAEGDTVQDRLDAQGAFDEASAVPIALALAEALAHVHRHGVIHRDVKPANVILTTDGGVKLIDFGLARPIADEDWATAEAGNAIGTPEYISPEQTRGQSDLDPRSDLYALGATLYQMVTGRVPYGGSSRDVLRQHADPKSRPVPPGELNAGLSEGLVAVINRMMAKNREDRPRNAEELIADLCALERRDRVVPVENGSVHADGFSGAADSQVPHGESDGTTIVEEKPAEVSQEELVQPVASHDGNGQANPNALFERAGEWARQGAYDRAVSDLTEALRLEPGRARVFRTRADVLSVLKEDDRAIADYTEVLRIDPSDAVCHVRRGFLYQRVGDFVRARVDLYAAVGLNPDLPSAQNRLAWLLATCPDPLQRDGKSAVAAATRACELSDWNDPNRVDTLAAAHAESGDFLAAVAWQQKALTLLKEGSPLREPYLERLKLYTDQTPYREGSGSR